MRKLKVGPDPVIAFRKAARRLPRGCQRRQALRQVEVFVRARDEWVNEILYGRPGDTEPVGLLGRSPLSSLVDEMEATNS